MLCCRALQWLIISDVLQPLRLLFAHAFNYKHKIWDPCLYLNKTISTWNAYIHFSFIYSMVCLCGQDDSHVLLIKSDLRLWVCHWEQVFIHSSLSLSACASVCCMYGCHKRLVASVRDMGSIMELHDHCSCLLFLWLGITDSYCLTEKHEQKASLNTNWWLES